MASVSTKEKVLTEDSEELVNRIIQLRKREYCIRFISRTVGVEAKKVSWILANNLSNKAWKSAPPVSSEGRAFARKSFNEIVEEQFNHLTHFQLERANELEKEYFLVLQDIYKKVRGRGAFGRLHKLAPVVAYLFLKSKGYEVKKSDLMQGTDITIKEFAKRLNFIASIFPAFLKRDKERIVLDKLQRVQAHFNLSDEFARASLELFQSFYPCLKTTTESVAAGEICVLTAFKLGLEKPTCCRICRFLRISDSTVLYNLKKKVFPRAKLTSLVGSREEIRDLLRVL